MGGSQPSSALFPARCALPFCGKFRTEESGGLRCAEKASALTVRNIGTFGFKMPHFPPRTPAFLTAKFRGFPPPPPRCREVGAGGWWKACGTWRLQALESRWGMMGNRRSVAFCGLPKTRGTGKCTRLSIHETLLFSSGYAEMCACSYGGGPVCPSHSAGKPM